MKPGFEHDAFANWIRHMRRGEFEAAWAISDRTLRSTPRAEYRYLPRHLQQVWDGTEFDGKKVLIRCYHGLGDTIQFIRYAPLVHAVAKEVSAAVQPELVPLVRTVRGIDRLLNVEAADAETSYDVDVEVMELPHVFRTTLHTIPANIPYFHVDPALLPRGGQLAVGIVWAAGDWDTRRSIPFPALAPLAEIPGIELHVLQREPALGGWTDGFGVLSATHDLLAMARLVRALDLLISVDTMAAHLAGALGVPVWTLLHTDADWRWMEKRNDSPWYPTMRLFRQEQSGDWPPVIAAVAAELARRAGAFRRRADLPTSAKLIETITQRSS